MNFSKRLHEPILAILLRLLQSCRLQSQLQLLQDWQLACWKPHGIPASLQPLSGLLCCAPGVKMRKNISESKVVVNCPHSTASPAHPGQA